MQRLWVIALLLVACTSDDSVPPKKPHEPRPDSHVAPCEAPRMRIDLIFWADSDFDLHVLTPAENEIYYGNTLQDGGELEDDLCITMCGPGVHAEAVFFCSNVPKGTYQAWVENYDGRTRGTFNVSVGGAASGALQGYLIDIGGDASETLEFDVH